MYNGTRRKRTGLVTTLTLSIRSFQVPPGSPPSPVLPTLCRKLSRDSHYLIRNQAPSLLSSRSLPPSASRSRHGCQPQAPSSHHALGQFNNRMDLVRQVYGPHIHVVGRNLYNVGQHLHSRQNFPRYIPSTTPGFGENSYNLSPNSAHMLAVHPLFLPSITFFIVQTPIFYTGCRLTNIDSAEFSHRPCW
jgi:hypothetical protein